MLNPFKVLVPLVSLPLMSSPQDHSGVVESSSGDSPTLSDNGNESAQPLSRRPIPRKGHTKSRRGCYNCKKRRIKCNERHPECSHCIKVGLRCEYPANIIQAMQRPLTLPPPQEVGKPPSTLGIFSMADMRLFHHFLITAYPHLPVGADKIWTTTIPGFAHRYEYLMHSILALAASHLDAITHSGVAEQAIQHRILAMKSLNEALSAPPTTSCERDARMAAAIALAFQSSHLQDGMAEFLTMVRGCNLIGGDETLLTHDSIFSAFREDCHLRTMQMRVGTSPLTCVNHEDLDMAASSLNLIKALRMSEWERSYWEILVRAVSHAYDSPVETYTTFVMLYNTPSQWTHDEFQAFINPSNSVAQILLAHFIAIQAILTPILYLERVDFQGVHAPTAVLGWIEETYWNIPCHIRHHVEWPRKVSRYPFMRFVGQNRVEYCDTDPLPA